MMHIDWYAVDQSRALTLYDAIGRFLASTQTRASGQLSTR